jgi:phosphoribosylanthranilate isomerase
MKIRVKICGNTNLGDARAATEAGADMLGFIFYSPSPRDISPEATADIVAALREEYGEAAPTMVGVFVDDSVERVREIMEQAQLDLAQLHGSEPPVEVRMLQPRAFKAIRPQTRGDAEAIVATYDRVLNSEPEVPDFLLDAYHPWKMGGTGQSADRAVGMLLAQRFKLLLAGGLAPETVAEAVRAIKPWGVDVVSGIEQSKGVKDHERMRAFIREARAAAETIES